ncbi:MAG: class I SAM-dependent methyltransferase [Planctomycetota bacterium]|nr:MAG: class I SAM-dependent methyltransferase [Planctomycetota bacterium]REK26324.1 MAG: class I SAM-dependent methyltransferase [Planctomycetota bacterium]REK45875.1 MAG: class I SAM-dependent methyltransferase [Planctomycetota bacterium]
MSQQRRADWQLPPGVTRGLADYVESEHIAEDYDDFFAANSLFEFDEAVIARHFRRPGLVADLGCGTGRALLPLLRRGFRGLAVDLSPAMLRIVREKAELDALSVDVVLANLVELDCVADEVADYALSMFSTLGMIQGRQNRARALRHMQRILKPGGKGVLHMHNVWTNLFDPPGRRYLMTHLPRALLAALRGRDDVELGDKVMPYRGIPHVYLHSFTCGQLRRGLRAAGFDILEVIPLSATRQRPLTHGWWLPRLRANGWIAVVRKPA